VVAVSRAGLPAEVARHLAGVAEVRAWPREVPPSPAELAELVRGCSALLAMGNDRIDAALLEAAGPGLRVVALASMGYDSLDVAAAAAAGVTATHTPSVLAETTADLAFALILMARRRLRVAASTLHAGRWRAFGMGDLLGLDVHGARLGLIGYGQIGQAVARRGAGFGMSVTHLARSRPSDGLSRAVGLDELVTTSDVLSIHVPLTPETRGLVGRDLLARMKPTATLVNTSRGGIVDEEALLEALAAGRLHSAGLDVMEREPRTDPADALLAEERLVVLPHVGSATEATRTAMADLAARNITEVLSGRPARTPIPGTPSTPRRGTTG
jgi:lactate dehydrogenase-like 2-hydroxyacid dehydrogenase